MSRRLAGIDVLRVLGIIAVIVGHGWGQVDWVRAAIYSWHVPLFFVLTGYFWSSDRSMSDEARRRGDSLARP